MTRAIDDDPIVAKPYQLLLLRPDDVDELFAAYAQIVDSGAGFPHVSPFTRAAFDDYWIAHCSAVWIARLDGQLVGAYYVKPNFVGRAAHISNAGYFVLEPYRGQGLGRGWWSILFAKRGASGSMPCSSIWYSHPIRPVTCTENLAFGRWGGYRPPWTVRTR